LVGLIEGVKLVEKFQEENECADLKKHSKTRS